MLTEQSNKTLCCKFTVTSDSSTCADLRNTRVYKILELYDLQQEILHRKVSRLLLICHSINKYR